MMSYLRTAVAPVITAIVIASLAGGCSTAWYGGAPEPSFDVNKDLERLADQFEPADSITEFYKAPPSEALSLRNKFITGRVTMMNIRYIQFVRKLTSERQLLDSAAAMLTLGLNLAGTTAGSAGTKTILAAIAAGITGSKEVIDKNYFFEKTIPALVAQMNAERKKALVPLLAGSRVSLDEYPFTQAVTDLHNYYNAGTFVGAIQAIQADAGVKEQKQDEVIATLTPLTIEVIASKEALTKAIKALTPSTPSDLDKIKAAIKNLDNKVIPADDPDKALEQLQSYVRGARTSSRIAEVAKAFKAAGISVEQ
jgi:hypothetical protein